MNPKIKIVYVTSSAFKKAEADVFARRYHLSDGSPVESLFEFEIREVPISELLEVDLQIMVQAEVTKAYSQIRVPCIVEHAGLIFEDFLSESYPGGLTKPMWRALGDKFVVETHSSGRRAVARAVVAYCDGARVETFVGETSGILAAQPLGSRQFYWDTVFIPDGPTFPLTYAQIVDDPRYGLDYKITNLSQSAKALIKFLEFRRTNRPSLWPRMP